MSDWMAIKQLKDSLSQKIIGQDHLVDRLLIALLANGHLLVEGAPGLAKTKAIKALSEGIEGDFHRIQFTPDLLPADVTGTEIYRPQSGTFAFQPGPIFHNLVLADEINRAPAKVQSALLEAMAEKQISVGSITHKLPPLFLVMATQNPIEQEGTYPLPEAQLDRFLMHVKIDYPSADAERKILALSRIEASASNDSAINSPTDAEKVAPVAVEKLSLQSIFSVRKKVLEMHMVGSVEEYIVQLVLATRNARHYSEQLASWIEYGASPRGTIGLDACARTHAWLNHRDFVTPEDVQAVVHDVLRHRIGLSFEAEAKGIQPDQIINEILNLVPAP